MSNGHDGAHVGQAPLVLEGLELDRLGALRTQVTPHFDDRELAVIVGPSGCGKSTLLRLIAGLEEVTSGDVYIDGERLNDVPPARRGLAMVFQNYALYPHMSVADNIGQCLLEDAENGGRAVTIENNILRVKS